MRRVLAHRIVYRGAVHRLCTVDIAGADISIIPFTQETAATPFVDGTVLVLSASALPALCWPDTASDAVLAALPHIVDEWSEGADDVDGRWRLL